MYSQYTAQSVLLSFLQQEAIFCSIKIIPAHMMRMLFNMLCKIFFLKSSLADTNCSLLNIQSMMGQHLIRSVSPPITLVLHKQVQVEWHDAFQDGIHHSGWHPLTQSSKPISLYQVRVAFIKLLFWNFCAYCYSEIIYYIQH